MRSYLLATAFMAIPGIAVAQSQRATVGKAVEPFIQIPSPIEVTGQPLAIAYPRSAAARETAIAAHSDRPPAAVDVSPASAPPKQARLDDVPILQHVTSAGAQLVDLGTSHGLRTVAAQHGGEFMIFQVAPDGQVAVAGLMTDLTVDQLKAISGSALTELNPQHGLRSFFLRSGARFQVFYATPDGERVIPGVMWDATGQDVTRKAIGAIPGAVPTVTVGATAPNARVSPVMVSSFASAPAQLDSATYGTAGNASAPQLWAFIDPQCSFSIRAMQALQPYVDAGRVRLHLIPLSILDSEDNGLSTHHALGLVSTPPDRMLAAWETGRYSDSVSADAAPKLAANMAAAAASQVRGTPTFFWQKPDGSQGRLDGVPADMGALIAALGS